MSTLIFTVSDFKHYYPENICKSFKGITFLTHHVDSSTELLSKQIYAYYANDVFLTATATVAACKDE